MFIWLIVMLEQGLLGKGITTAEIATWGQVLKYKIDGVIFNPWPDRFG